MPLYAIIRIRGTVDVHPEVETTLRLLRLHRRYTASLYHSSLPGLEGMLRKVENWATWGEIDAETLVELLRIRGRLVGDKPITDLWVAENLKILGGIPELARKLVDGELHYHELEKYGVKPFFRLHPPRGGFRGSIKRHYKAGGELGYRGPAINDLIRRML
ncbi:MAG: 50S ribosomal protein L30 [Desulfurococcales archaeon]|nr:50S ribosomal protein L30 [Desulfurococcales archaeon]